MEDLNDKVFKIDVKENDSIDFRFVNLKIKEFQVSEYSKKRTLIQIIDMSDKMLYNKVKAE